MECIESALEPKTACTVLETMKCIASALEPKTVFTLLGKKFDCRKMKVASFILKPPCISTVGSLTAVFTTKYCEIIPWFNTANSKH